MISLCQMGSPVLLLIFSIYLCRYTVTEMSALSLVITLRALQLVISAPIQSLLERVVIRDLLRAVSYCVYEC